MKLASAVVFLVGTLILLFAFYLHDSAHRYDVVLAAAGSGGSQQAVGSTETEGYLVDHKTGRVWELTGVAQRPMMIVRCPNSANVKESERGCEVESTPTKP